jgi:YqaJ-like viral recombinase domain
MITLNCEQGSEDWLHARIGACTASRFSDARGKLTKASKNGAAGDPNGDAIAYAWTIAIETVARKPLDETFTTYAMRRGRELEPYARSVYETRTGAWIDEASLVLTDDGHFGYSTDGLRDDDGMIEIKCPMNAMKIGSVWANPGSAHLEYLDQIQGGLWITGRKYCDLIVYCDWLKDVGKDLFVKRIYRDEAYIEALESDLLGFWKLVETNLVTLRSSLKMSGAPKNDPTTTETTS